MDQSFKRSTAVSTGIIALMMIGYTVAQPGCSTVQTCGGCPPTSFCAPAPVTGLSCCPKVQSGSMCMMQSQCPQNNQCLANRCQPSTAYVGSASQVSSYQPYPVNAQVLVEVPPGHSCPLPGQRCGGGSSCKQVLNIGTCTCPGGGPARGGRCTSGGFGGSSSYGLQQQQNCPGVMVNNACLAGAGDYCGGGGYRCVPNAQCRPDRDNIPLCRCNPQFTRSGKSCLNLGHFNGGGYQQTSNFFG